MSPAHKLRSWRALPVVLAVTAAVAVAPILLVWGLRRAGALTSSWLALTVAVVLSLAISIGLRALWARHSRGSDLLFSELLLWGWLSHRRSERRLESAARLLGAFDGPARDRLTPERRGQLLRQLANALDSQDAYLNGHSRRVARHAEKIGRRLGLPGRELAKLRAAAAIHDVGKLHVPRRLLEKPGALTEAEFERVRRHAQDGAAMVSALGDPVLTSIVRHHHERIDGHGYPDRLAGEEIPLGARIVAVADTFDAITSPRPYRPAAGHRQALETLRRCAGTQLDPDAVRAFLSCYSGRRRFLLVTLLAEMPRQALARAMGVGSTLGAVPGSNVLATVGATAAIAATAAALPAGRAAPGQRRAAVRSAFAATPATDGPAAYAFGLPIAASTVTTAGGPPPATRSRARHRAAARHAARRTVPPAATSPARPDTSSTAASPTAAPAPAGHRHRPASPPARAHAPRRHPAAVHHAHRPAHWTAPGRTGAPPPGRSPGGPPGRTGATPGQSGTPPPGLRGQTPPGKANG